MDNVVLEKVFINVYVLNSKKLSFELITDYLIRGLTIFSLITLSLYFSCHLKKMGKIRTVRKGKKSSQKEAVRF